MDPSLLLMLSNLIHLQNQLDPTTSLLSEPNSSSPLSSSAAAPLLFFTIASVLSYASTVLLHRSNSPSSSSTNNNNDIDSSASLAAFRALSTDRIWSMDPLARDAQWRASYGISYPVFSSLVDHLKPHLARSNLSIPYDYAVAIVLSRLAHAHSPSRLARSHNLDPFLVSKITNTVTRLLSTKLYPDFIKIPTGHRLLQTVNSFRDVTSLPNMCGAITGSAVRVPRLPSSVDDPSVYLCRHGFPAVLLQAVADHRRIFWDVCVKAPGSVDDTSHLRDSLLYHRLASAEILRDSVVTVRGNQVRPYVVGDSRYPLLPFLLTPFSDDSSGTPAQNMLDAAIARGRKAVEHAIELLKGRWRILQDLNVGLNHAPQTIVACCVLHNICQIGGEPEPPLFKEPKEAAGPPARPLESEKSFHHVGERLRQAMADDLQERQQRLSSR